MTALPIKGLQQSFIVEIQKFEQQIKVAIERLQTALSFSVCRTKSRESDRRKLRKLSAALRMCPEISHFRFSLSFLTFSNFLFSVSLLAFFSHFLFSISFLNFVSQFRFSFFSHFLFSLSFLTFFSHFLFSLSFLTFFSHFLFSISFLNFFSHFFF